MTWEISIVGFNVHDFTAENDSIRDILKSTINESNVAMNVNVQDVCNVFIKARAFNCVNVYTRLGRRWNLKQGIKIV